MAGFYGNITSNPLTTYDKIYPNRYTLEREKQTDNILPGRQVLIEYDTEFVAPIDSNGNNVLEKEHQEALEKLANYEKNKYLDEIFYHKNYDSTIWRKEYYDGNYKYVQTAELNGVGFKLIEFYNGENSSTPSSSFYQNETNQTLKIYIDKGLQSKEKSGESSVLIQGTEYKAGNNINIIDDTIIANMSLKPMTNNIRIENDSIGVYPENSEISEINEQIIINLNNDDQYEYKEYPVYYETKNKEMEQLTIDNIEALKESETSLYFKGKNDKYRYLGTFSKIYQDASMSLMTLSTEEEPTYRGTVGKRNATIHYDWEYYSNTKHLKIINYGQWIGSSIPTAIQQWAHPYNATQLTFVDECVSRHYGELHGIDPETCWLCAKLKHLTSIYIELKNENQYPSMDNAVFFIKKDAFYNMSKLTELQFKINNYIGLSCEPKFCRPSVRIITNKNKNNQNFNSNYPALFSDNALIYQYDADKSIYLIHINDEASEEILRLTSFQQGSSYKTTLNIYISALEEKTYKYLNIVNGVRYKFYDDKKNLVDTDLFPNSWKTLLGFQVNKSLWDSNKIVESKDISISLNNNDYFIFGGLKTVEDNKFFTIALSKEKQALFFYSPFLSYDSFNLGIIHSLTGNDTILIKTVSKYCFRSNSSLLNIDFPPHVLKLPEGLLTSLQNLKTITFGSSNPAQYGGNYTYENNFWNKNLKIYYGGGLGTTFVTSLNANENFKINNCEIYSQQDTSRIFWADNSFNSQGMGTLPIDEDKTSTLIWIDQRENEYKEGEIINLPYSIVLYTKGLTYTYTFKIPSFYDSINNSYTKFKLSIINKKEISFGTTWKEGFTTEDLSMILPTFDSRVYKLINYRYDVFDNTNTNTFLPPKYGPVSLEDKVPVSEGYNSEEKGYELYLYPIVEPVMYEAIFEGNSELNQKIQVFDKSTYIITLSTLSIPGYIFKGWKITGTYAEKDNTLEIVRVFYKENKWKLETEDSSWTLIEDEENKIKIKDNKIPVSDIIFTPILEEKNAPILSHLDIISLRKIGQYQNGLLQLDYIPTASFTEDSNVFLKSNNLELFLGQRYNFNGWNQDGSILGNFNVQILDNGYMTSKYIDEEDNAFYLEEEKIKEKDKINQTIISINCNIE